MTLREAANDESRRITPTVREGPLSQTSFKVYNKLEELFGTTGQMGFPGCAELNRIFNLVRQ
jgi:hypothetical protein